MWAGGARSHRSDVCQDGIAHLMLQRIFLRASAFGVIDCERLRTPVEVAQQQTTYLPTAQTINCQKVQDCSGAHRGRSVAPYRFKQPLYLVPCWSFGQALMNVEPG
jgi:hypothetical protein